VFSYQRVYPNSHPHTKYYLPKHMNALYRVFSFKHQYTLSMLKDAFLYPNSNFRRIRYKLLSKLKSLKFCYQYWVILFFTKAHLHSLLSVRCVPLLILSTLSMFLIIFFVRIRWHWSFNLFIPLLPPIWMQGWFESMQTVESEISTIGANWQTLLRRCWFTFFDYY